MSTKSNLQYGFAAALGGDENTLNIQQTSDRIPSLPLPFPPTNQAQDLALNLLRSNKGNSPLDAFNIYRKLFLEHLESQGVQLSDPSSFILDAWSRETLKVKSYYSMVERLWYKALNETFDSVMSPVDLQPNSDETFMTFSVQDGNGYDFDLFHSGSSQSVGPPTPMSITNSPFVSSNLSNSENDAN
ncbi:7662_t:CDS:2, partial [Cetraspora pellucida]